MDAKDSAVAWRGRTQDTLTAPTDNSSSFLATLDAFRLSLTSVADIAVLLTVFPLLMFTGPTQTDTAYGALLPGIILAVCPLLGWLMTKTISSRHWPIVTVLVRIVLATVISYSSEFPFLSGGFLSIVLAFAWGMRLQELVVMEDARARSQLLNAAVFLVPVVALFAVLKYYNAVQQYLVGGSIALYSTALIVSLVSSLIRNATAATTTTNSRIFSWSLGITLGLASYEIFLSCIAGLIGVVPVILLLTDQSTILPALRADVIISLSGWLAGGLFTIFFLLRRNSPVSESRHYATLQERIQRLKLEHIHLMFTVLLAALSLCKTSSTAYPLLFLTAATAASLTLKCSESREPSEQIELHTSPQANSSPLRPTWQPAVTLAILTIASVFAYVDLSPKLSALQPIHVDRTLAALCFIPSLIAVFVWPGSRKIILNLVAYLVPVQNPLNHSFSFYITKNLEITNAIMIGWRLNATIVVLTTAEANAIVNGALRLGNIHALSISEWRLSSEAIRDRVSHGERFLVFDFTGTEIENLSPLSPNSTIGLIERVNDPNAIVISDMVPTTKASVYGSAR